MLAKTQKECKEKLERAIEKNGKVDVVRSGKYTVAEWVRLWFETYSKPSIREQTAYYYNNYIEKHIIPGIGGTLPRQRKAEQPGVAPSHRRQRGRIPGGRGRALLGVLAVSGG